jgi:hypothetical protein
VSWEVGVLDINGTMMSGRTDGVCSDFFKVEHELHLGAINYAQGYYLAVYKYDKDKTFVSRELYETAGNNSVTLFPDEYLYRIRCLDSSKATQTVTFARDYFRMEYVHAESLSDLVMTALYGSDEIGYTELLTLANSKVYESWAKMAYDSENNNILVAYSSGDDHANGHKDLRMCIVNDGVGRYVTIAEASEVEAYKAMGVFVQNGSYVVFATYGTQDHVDKLSSVRIYRSDDCGFTWNMTETDLPVTKNGSVVNIDNVSRIDGKYYTLANWYNSGVVEIFSSSDGINWQGFVCTAQANTQPCEGIFLKVKHRYICLARLHQAINANSGDELAFCYSDDFGATWTNFAQTTGIHYANSSNLSALRLTKDKLLVVYGSRQNSETAGIYASVTDIADAYSGTFNYPTKLLSGTPTANFGYPFVVKTDYGYFLSYYSGENSGASIKLVELDLKTGLLV